MPEESYSTLEVSQRDPPSPYCAYTPRDRETSLPEAAPVDGKEARWAEGPAEGLELAPKHEHIYAAPPYVAQGSSNQKPSHSPRRKYFLLIGAIFLVVAIVAAVLGGVLGSRKNNTSSPKPTSASSSSTSSTAASSIPTATATTGPRGRNIAAVSFVENAKNTTRVYYQDNSGELWEAESSDGSGSWKAHSLGFSAVGGSALAAAVSRPGFPLQISLLYADSKLVLHDMIYSASTDSWTNGSVSRQGYTISANSSISALYDQCRFCPNVSIIAFQDQNHAVQIGNLTATGWGLTQLSGIDSHVNSGLALQLLTLGDGPHQINLYHQKTNLILSLASWRPSIQDWSLNQEAYDAIPTSAPIAASGSFSNIPNSINNWIEVLAVTATGIAVNTFSGSKNRWIQLSNQPSIMSNATASTDTALFYSVAVTVTGAAFAAVKMEDGTDAIKSWQVKDSTVDWDSEHNVDIGSSWG